MKRFAQRSTVWGLMLAMNPKTLPVAVAVWKVKDSFFFGGGGSTAAFGYQSAVHIMSGDLSSCTKGSQGPLHRTLQSSVGHPSD